MSKWILKAVVQKLISFLPFKHRINYLFQKYITRGVRLSEEYFEDRLLHLQHHRGFYEKYKGAMDHTRVLELGTGWYPVIPVGLFLSGAEEVITVDISRLTGKDKFITTLEKFREYHEERQLGAYLQVKPERMEAFRKIFSERHSLSFEELLRQFRIRYLVADARHLPLEDSSIDLITSNNTFEHIYPNVLEEILQEFYRLLKPNGLQSHFVDMSDHFAHLDTQITIYNFLQFSEQQWAWIDNSIQPQNRWRIIHYRKLYQKLGIPVSEELNRPGNMNDLRAVAIDAAFRTISETDLAVSHSYIISDMSNVG